MVSGKVFPRMRCCGAQRRSREVVKVLIAEMGELGGESDLGKEAKDPLGYSKDRTYINTRK